MRFPVEQEVNGANQALGYQEQPGHTGKETHQHFYNTALFFTANIHGQNLL